MQSSDKPQLLGEHLSSLRGCLLRSLLFLGLGFFIIFIFFTPELVQLVLSPVRSYSFILGRVPDVGNLIVIHVLDKFVITLIISIFGAFFLSVPYSFFEFWKFLRPALSGREMRVFILFFPFIMLFFTLGALFGYFLVLPVSIDFLANFGDESFVLSGIETSITVLSYLRYFFLMTFFLGLIFELPLILMLIVRVTDLEPRDFAKYRRHFMALSFIIAMFLTPPDVVTQIMLALPMILMYEAGIILTRIAQRKKNKIAYAETADSANDFENENSDDKVQKNTETLQPDVITGFSQDKQSEKTESNFENNKLSSNQNYDIIDSSEDKKSKQYDKENEKNKTLENIDAKFEEYFSDPTISVLSKEQIQAVLRLIEKYLNQRNLQ